MNLDMHQAIAGKLEAGKLAGWLSEYLVAWHGPSDGLEPEVTVWRTSDQNDETIRAQEQVDRPAAICVGDCAAARPTSAPPAPILGR